MWKYIMTSLLGAILLTGLGVSLYEKSGEDTLLQIGGFGVITCMALLMISGAVPEPGSFLHDVVLHKPTQEDIDALYSPKTGYEPEEIEAERQAYNEAIRSAALWGCEPDSTTSYIDYDGNKRSATTNELLYMNKNNKGNGRR